MVMTEYELYSYEAFRKHLHDDERPIERAIIEDLDVRILGSYMQAKRAERPGFAQLSEERAYELMDVLRSGKPTLAAVMNMGIYPQGFLPQLCIIAVVVPGDDIGDTDEQDIRFLDNKRIEGTLSEQVTEAIAFCKRNMKTRTIIDKQTGARKDVDEYPIAAIREAILNAVVHRDYSIYTEGTPVQLVLYRNRIEIHSPGNLYGRMTVDQLGVARPDLRNPALATMAESLTRAENRYSGIPTMRREMKLHGLPEPVFENRRNEFVVTFFNAQVAEQREETKDTEPESGTASLLEFCRIPRTRAEIKDFMNIGTFSYIYSRYIATLVESGQMKLTLPDKPRSRKQQYQTVKDK
jgi:ATP-dependent DNA helicase RecG